MKTTLFASLVSLALLTALPVFAMDMSRYTGHFDDIDTNGDGKISQEEIVAYFPDDDGHRKHIMILSDKDKSGDLDHDEWHYWKEKYAKTKGDHTAHDEHKGDHKE